MASWMPTPVVPASMPKDRLLDACCEKAGTDNADRAAMANRIFFILYTD